MNVHYDIILKTTENNNAMRWWKTLKVSHMRIEFVSSEERDVWWVTTTEPPKPVKYHYHLAIDGETEV